MCCSCSVSFNLKITVCIIAFTPHLQGAVSCVSLIMCSRWAKPTLTPKSWHFFFGGEVLEALCKMRLDYVHKDLKSRKPEIRVWVLSLTILPLKHLWVLQVPRPWECLVHLLHHP